MQLIIQDDAGGRTAHQILPPGAMIGRGSANQIVLPDDSGRVSLTQALISMTQQGQVVIKNLSSRPLLVNQQPLGFGQTRALNEGHIIQIGQYVCTVSGTQGQREPTVLPMPGGATAGAPGLDQHRETAPHPAEGQVSAPEDIASLIAFASAPAQPKRDPAQPASSPLFDHLPAAQHSQPPAVGAPSAQTDIFASLLGGDALPVGSSTFPDLHPFEQKSRIDNPYHDPLQNLTGDVKFEEEKDPLKVLSTDGSEHLKADIFSNTNPSTLNTAGTGLDLTELDRLLEEISRKP